MKVLGGMINTVLKEKPESFESYDDKTFGIMLRIFPKLIKKLGGNPFKILWDFLPEVKMILTGGIPKLVLMAEFVGDTEEEVIAAAKKAQEAILAEYKVSTHVTKTQKEGEKFWAIRRESFKLLRENVHGKHTAPFIDDISVRPERLPEFLPKLYAIMSDYKLVFTIAGHIGDGNFHIIPLMDYSRPDFSKIIRELSERVYTLVGEYDGSITGEHNDGLIRTPYLDHMFSKEMLDVFEKVKDSFDPDGIFNPHKKVDGDMDLLLQSIKSQVKS
jgi:FAD/FMN-containing dehydrogenase